MKRHSLPLLSALTVLLLAVAAAVFWILDSHLKDIERYTAIEYMAKKKAPGPVLPHDLVFADLLKGINSLADYNSVFTGSLSLRPRAPKILERIPTNENAVFLTFDDGPYADGDGAQVGNARLLDILAEKRSTGTFFFQGPWALKNAALVKRTVAAGCTVGNHTYHHPPDGCSMGPIPCGERKKLEGLDHTWQVREILWCRVALIRALDGDITGLTNYFRSPHGSGVVSYPRRPASPKVIQCISDMGYIIINGDERLSDAKQRVTKRSLLKAYRAGFRSTAPGAHRGRILWLHSGLRATAEALPEIIDLLQKKGYAVRALPASRE
jgi:peptidoglycan/xylan/chitin deacetylase (PgdA/CDA1 family)